jgi:hypothetical protein
MANGVSPLPARDDARPVLGPAARRVVVGLAEALFAPDGEASPERLTAVALDTDAFLSFASRRMRRAIALGLFVVRWLPLLVLRRAAPFDQLDRADRVRFVEALDRSKVPALPLLLALYKTILAMIFFEDEATLVTLGVPRPGDRTYLALARTRALVQAEAPPPDVR